MPSMILRATIENLAGVFFDGTLEGTKLKGFLTLESPPRVVAQFQSPRGFRALYVTATEFALTQACPELSYDPAPHI